MDLARDKVKFLTAKWNYLLRSFKRTDTCGYHITSIFRFHWLLLKDRGNSCNSASIFNAQWKLFSLQLLNLIIASTSRIRLPRD